MNFEGWTDQQLDDYIRSDGQNLPKDILQDESRRDKLLERLRTYRNFGIIVNDQPSLVCGAKALFPVRPPQNKIMAWFKHFNLSDIIRTCAYIIIVYLLPLVVIAAIIHANYIEQKAVHQQYSGEEQSLIEFKVEEQMPILEVNSSGEYAFFDGDGKLIGELKLENGQFVFEGDAEKSARIFFDELSLRVSKYK